MLLAMLLAAASPDPVAAALASAGPGARIGLVVTDERGREVVAIRPDERFVPASNTKIFTTALAMQRLDTAGPDRVGGAAVRLEGRDVVLSGHGDARLSSAADCRTDCLVDLVKAVAARTHVVRDVIGDDSAFPDERWPSGMSWNNIPTMSGTAISALTLDDNVTALSVTPGAVGAAATVTSDGYYRIENATQTTAGGRSAIGVQRLPDRRILRLVGTIARGASPVRVVAGIDDPAERAAWRFAALLRAGGVRVTGRIAVRHRPVAAADDPAERSGAPAPRPPELAPLAQLAPPPLADDVRHTLKVSQNLHADLLLRRVAAQDGGGSVADGEAALRTMLSGIGVPRWQYDFADGSGMSTYNRVTPRAVVAVLRWTQMQPWGPAWRAMLPQGGVDGGLKRRFGGTPLDGKLFAKTGTLNQSNCLSGFLIAASGRTLTFSALANDMPGDASATAAVDRALLAVAAAN